jgi:hypothetical protein
MRAEHTRLYRALSARACFGFDVAAGHDGGYRDLARLTEAGASPDDRSASTQWARVAGETIEEEIARLRAGRDRAATLRDARVLASLDALIDGLSYIALLRGAATYEATRPAMAFREDAMKRRFTAARALFGSRMTLMGHALHLAKDDRRRDAPGLVGPGGDRVASLGHYIVQECGLRAFSIWMLYAEGEDSQPLPDLPRRAQFPRESLNAHLAAAFKAPTLLLTRDAPTEPVVIGQMYNSTFRASLPAQADAVYFVPRVTAMRAQ